MHDVFLSHSSEDKPRVEILVKALRAEELDVWWDRDLRPGDAYVPEIQRALEASRCLVVCWSRSAVDPRRVYVQGEAEKARKASTVISVLLDKVDVPVPFNASHYADLVDWGGDRSEARFRELVEAIKAKAEAPAAPSSSPPSAGPKKRSALLVGVGAHDADLPALPAARRDLDSLRRVLEQPACGFEVRVLDSPDRQTLATEVEAFFRAVGPDDLRLFYFAGHAFLSRTNTFSLLARDSRPDSKSTHLSLRELSEYFDSSTDGQVLLIFDTCYFGEPRRPDIEQAWQAYLGAGRGKVVLASGPGAGAGAWEGQSSPLTDELVSALELETGALDENKDQIVTADELIAYLHRALDSKGDLRPMHWSFGAAPTQITIRGRGAIKIHLTDEQRRFVDRLGPDLEHRKVIPLLGDGIYGAARPLSFHSMARALAAEARLADDIYDNLGIATAAELLALQYVSRQEFLEALQKILSDQMSACEPPKVHELILGMKPPWLAIDINYDNLLERRLDEEGRPYVTVHHVLHAGDDAVGSDAKNAEYAGQLLVVRSKNHPRVLADPSWRAVLCTHDKLSIARARGDGDASSSPSEDKRLLSADDCVIYKLLGSPFLDDVDLVRDCGLDTVVITETDHIDFLTKLRSGTTGVPIAFSSQLRTRNLLFLEYNLDIWHYRLIGHIFRLSTDSHPTGGSVSLNRKPYVVRTAITAMEEQYWARLKPDRISMDLPTLVRALRARSPSP